MRFSLRECAKNFGRDLDGYRGDQMDMAASIYTRYRPVTIVLVVRFLAPYYTSVNVCNVRLDIQRNFGYVLESTRLAVPLLRESGRGGSIVNFTTGEAHRGAGGFAVYAGAKAATTNFSRAMAWEFGPEGIRINVVAPDTTASEGNRRALPAELQALNAAHPSNGGTAPIRCTFPWGCLRRRTILPTRYFSWCPIWRVPSPDKSFMSTEAPRPPSAWSSGLRTKTSLCRCRQARCSRRSSARNDWLVGASDRRRRHVAGVSVGSLGERAHGAVSIFASYIVAKTRDQPTSCIDRWVGAVLRMHSEVEPAVPCP